MPGLAWAGWGQENWGAMVWGQSAPVAPVPGLGWLGLTVLALGLAATAAWGLRKRRPALGLTLMLALIAVPLVVVAGEVTLPNTFSNNTVADANEVNANFDAVKTAVDDNDARIGAAQSAAASAQRTADAASFAATAAQEAADAALAAVAQGIASIQINSAGVLELTLGDGTVLNVGTVSVPSSPALAQGAWNSAIWGPIHDGGVWQ